MTLNPTEVRDDKARVGPEQRDFLAWHVLRLGTLVRRAVAQRFRRMFDLSMLEWLIVVHLSADAPVSLTMLSRHAGLDPQRTGLAVTRLAKRDLLVRRKNPVNAREAQVSLTPRGQAVFNAIIENWLEKELASAFTEAERAGAIAILSRLSMKADQLLQDEIKGAV